LQSALFYSREALRKIATVSSYLPSHVHMIAVQPYSSFVIVSLHRLLYIAIFAKANSYIQDLSFSKRYSLTEKIIQNDLIFLLQF